MKKETIKEQTKAREELWAVIQRMREPFKDGSQEEIEREVDKAVAQVRAEMRAERARKK
jgi:Ni,Fe-hydrogenase maturation factor